MGIQSQAMTAPCIPSGSRLHFSIVWIDHAGTMCAALLASVDQDEVTGVLLGLPGYHVTFSVCWKGGKAEAPVVLKRVWLRKAAIRLD